MKMFLRGRRVCTANQKAGGGKIIYDYSRRPQEIFHAFVRAKFADETENKIRTGRKTTSQIVFGSRFSVKARGVDAVVNNLDFIFRGERLKRACDGVRNRDNA